MSTDTAAERDRLYFQRERELLTAIAEGTDQCEALATAVCSRLIVLDEIDDALAFQFEGFDDGSPNRFRGQPAPWLQMQLGAAVAELAGAARQLQAYAADLVHDAQLTARSGRQGRIARGYLALAAEANRVADSYGPMHDALLPDWDLINRIHDGVRRLEDMQDADLREELAHDLRVHDQRLADLRTTGLVGLAGQVDADPALQRALATMREFSGMP